MKKNNVKYLRLRKGWGLERLVEVSGIPMTTLHRIENGQDVDKYRVELSTALGCDPQKLDEPDFDVPTVPVVGIIKHKSYVKMLPEKEWMRTEYFEGLPETAKAVIVGGSQLKPNFSIDSVLFYDAGRPAKEKLFMERQCLVEIPVAKKFPNYLICWVSRGTKAGLYTLTPYSQETLFDQPIVKAYPIIYSRQG